MHRIEKILLINSPIRISSFYDVVSCQPMGLAYLASVLRDKYDVKILDAIAMGREQERYLRWNYVQCGLSAEQILQEVEKFQPDVVGASCLFSFQLPVIAEIFKLIKSKYPEVITVTGGTHPSFLPEDSLCRVPDLDYIVIGEAEESFPQSLEAIEKGSTFSHIDGIAWRENGSVKVNPKTRFIENLDSIPFPAYDLLPMQKYFEINVPFMFYSKSPRNTSFLTSRGCPFKCTFCSSCHYWGNRVRYRSLENVLAEMRMLKEKFCIEELKFEEDNLLLNKERAKKLFRAMIDEKFNFYWNMPNGAYIMALLDEELVKLMKESGCYEVILAFESGDQYVLDNIVHKPLDLSRAERAVQILKHYDIDIHAFFIIGFPGETREQIKNTFRFARKMKIDKPYFFLFNPLPGSVLYQKCLEQKLITPEQVFETNYYYNALTTSEFNPKLLRKWQYSYTILQNVFLLFQNPRKLFGKYLKRVLNRKNFRAITKALRTAILSFFKE